MIGVVWMFAGPTVWDMHRGDWVVLAMVWWCAVAFFCAGWSMFVPVDRHGRARWKRKPVCLACGYSLAGHLAALPASSSSGVTCPECGMEHDRAGPGWSYRIANGLVGLVGLATMVVAVLFAFVGMVAFVVMTTV